MRFNILYCFYYRREQQVEKAVARYDEECRTQLIQFLEKIRNSRRKDNAADLRVIDTALVKLYALSQPAQLGAFLGMYIS